MCKRDTLTWFSIEHGLSNAMANMLKVKFKVLVNNGFFYICTPNEVLKRYKIFENINR